ncbi:MAG: histidine phosphatase family protein [Acidobacteriota bacterium]
MPVTTHILLVRHGQSLGNAEGRFGGHTDTPLSPLGRKQSEATAQALAAERVDAVYSSDLARSTETAAPLAKLIGLKVNPTDAFRERSVGVMEGLTFAEAAAKYPEQYAALLRRDFEHVLAGGESYRQTLDRAARKLDEILVQHKGGRVVVFTHTGTICILALHIMGALDSPRLKAVWIHSSNCGVSRFDLRDDDYVRVAKVNDTQHLAGL